MSATLHIIHSGSSANGYILTCGENQLIIEAGCKINEYLNALNYDITRVGGVIATHRATRRPRTEH